MAQKIKIPERTHEEFGHSIAELFRVVRLIVSSPEKEIELDFSQTRILHPFFLGGFVCSLHYFQSQSITFSFDYKDNYLIHSYLEQINFPNGFPPVSSPDNSSLKPLEEYKDKTFIPIIVFPTGSGNDRSILREKILNTVSELLKSQLHFKERERQPLSYFLDELTHNVNDHSGVAHSYVFAQFYPSSNYLDLVICDHGKGIYRSYEGNDRFSPQNEVEALQFAVSGKSTKDRPESKGFGISTSKNMLVHGLRGRFFIWPGRTAYIETAERTNVLDIPDTCYFQGTYVALRIPTIIPAGFNFYNYIE